MHIQTKEFHLPALHKHTRSSKLFDAKFYRNQMSRTPSEKDIGSNFQSIYVTEQHLQPLSLTDKQKSPPKTKPLSLLNDFAYTVKHFGSVCDTLFEDRTRFHLGEKFGRRLVKPGALTFKRRTIKDTTPIMFSSSHKMTMVPLEQPAIKNDIRIPTQETPKDMRDIVKIINWNEHDNRIFVKRVLIHKGIGMMILFKSFEITLIEDPVDNPEAEKRKGRKKKQAAPLRIFFGDLINLIKIDAENIVELIKNRMELVEGGRLKLDTEGWDFGTGMVPDWTLIQTDEVQADIGTKASRKYKVNYPTVELYVPEQQYTQVVQLKLSELVDLMKTNFDSLPEYAELFDFKKYEKQVKLNKLYEKRKLKEGVKEQVQPEQTGLEPQQSEPPAVEEEVDQVALIISDSARDFDTKYMEMKQIKETYKEGPSSYTIVFYSPQLQVLEKKSRRVVKSNILSFRQFYQLIVWSETKNVQEFFEGGIEVTFPELEESDWEFDRFKETCKFTLNLPEVSIEPSDLVKVGELNIENKLFSIHSKFFSVNNKALELQMLPAYFDLIDNSKKKQSTIKLKTGTLNDMIKRRFNVKIRVL